MGQMFYKIYKKTKLYQLWIYGKIIYLLFINLYFKLSKI